MRIYIASRYGRRAEMVEAARQLEALGHEVTSRWIDGEHEAVDATASDEERRGWALEDVADIDRCQVLLAFTEEPGAAGGGRGGRHIETGYALGCGKLVYLVGPSENVFHCLPQVQRWKTWGECLAWFTAWRAPLRREASHAG